MSASSSESRETSTSGDALNLHSRIHLAAGGIPRLGLGVYQLDARKAVKIVGDALRGGYLHVDTAALYDNEKEVGRAAKECGIAREELFVTTKLWNDAHGGKKARRAFEKSLSNLGLDYVDLYLMHSPRGGDIVGTWKEMVKLQRDGLVKDIGVSNFGVHHLRYLAEHSDVVPAVNQVEISPYLQRRELVDYCNRHGIVVEAYSPLTRGKRLGDRKLVALAAKYKVSTAQMLIRWSLQKGFVCIPKAGSGEHMRENMDVFGFAISERDMDKMDDLEEGLVTGWDPTEDSLSE